MRVRSSSTPRGRRSIPKGLYTPTATRMPNGWKPGTGSTSGRATGCGAPRVRAGPRASGTYFWGRGARGRRSSSTRAVSTLERLELMELYDISVLCQAPTEYRLLAKTPELERANLASIRHAVSAGEPLNPPVIERWKELHGLTIYDGYGQTENTLLVGNYPGL